MKRFFFGLAKLLLLLMALGLTAALAAWFTIAYVTEDRELVVVPELRGLDTTDALRKVTAVGLRLDIAEDSKSQYDATVPAKHVLRQEPSAGTKIKADRRVKVVLSRGPQNLYVPRVVGLTVSEAQIKLHEAGLTVGDIVYVHDSRAADATVIDQDATAAGAAPGGVVNLLVSAGGEAPIYVAPDFIGQAVVRVAEILERRSFKVKLEYEAYPGVEAGTIIRQKPQAGYPLRGRDVVWLWVSRPAGG